LQNRFCDIRWSVVYVVCDFGPAASVETIPVAKFIVPDWGDKFNSGIGCRTGPPGFIGWRAGTATLCQSRLYPPQSGTMNLANATAHWRVQYHKIHTVHFPSNISLNNTVMRQGYYLQVLCASSPYGKRDNLVSKLRW
jgi:hypothetical protein